MANIVKRHVFAILEFQGVQLFRKDAPAVLVTNPKEVMLVTMVQMSKVILLTSLTTAIGFLALLTTSIRIIQEFGLEIAIGVMIAWLVSILVVPSGILLLKGFQYQNQNIFSTPLEKLSLSIIKRPWAFIIIPILISGVAIIKVKEALVEEQTKGSFSLTIITGNSSVLQKRILNEILEDSPYTYYIPSWNLGQIIVEYMEL